MTMTMTPDNSPDDQPVARADCPAHRGEDCDLCGGTGSLYGITLPAAPVNQPDTLDEMLARHPDWKIAEIIVRRDRGWCYGGQLTYDALIECEGGDHEARGSGPTPTAALASALAKIGEVG